MSTHTVVRRVLLLGASVVLVLASTTACGSSSSKAVASGPVKTKTNLTIGVSAAIEVEALPQITMINDEFSKENLNVTVKSVPSASVPQLLAQGTIQIACTGLSGGQLNAIQSGVDLRIIGNAVDLAPNDPSGLWINKKFLKADGSLKKPFPSDFKLSLGNQGLGAVSAYWTQQYLKQNGVSLANIKNIDLSQSDIAVALQNGSIDAGFANDPYSGTLVGNPNLKLVARSGAALVYETTGSYIAHHSDVVQAALRAMLRSTQTYLKPGYRNDAKVMDQLSSWLHVPTATIEKAPAPVFLPTMSLDVLKPVYDGVQDIWIQAGIVSYKKPISYNVVADPRPLAAAVHSAHA
jgi:NitT/TauT family transport system substrate-binding protein